MVWSDPYESPCKIFVVFPPSVIDTFIVVSAVAFIIVIQDTVTVLIFANISIVVS